MGPTVSSVLPPPVKAFPAPRLADSTQATARQHSGLSEEMSSNFAERLQNFSFGMGGLPRPGLAFSAPSPARAPAATSGQVAKIRDKGPEVIAGVSNTADSVSDVLA